MLRSLPIRSLRVPHTRGWPSLPTKKGQTFLYAADGGPNRAVDMYNGTFAFVKSFSDPQIPKEFTTYGIQAIKGEIWVTFTPLDKAQGGFVDGFATDGTLLRHDAIHGPLHSPWGIALAPADFGPMSNAILILLAAKTYSSVFYDKYSICCSLLCQHSTSLPPRILVCYHGMAVIPCLPLLPVNLNRQTGNNSRLLFGRIR